MPRISKKALQTQQNTSIETGLLAHVIETQAISNLNPENYIIGSEVIDTVYPDIIPSYLPVGFIPLIGKSGSGKSWYAQKLTAIITTGGYFLGKEVAQGKVLYICKEVSQSELKRRIEWCGGNTENVIFVSDVVNEDHSKVLGTGSEKIAFSLPRHFSILNQLIDTFGPSLIVFDTFTRFIENSDKAKSPVFDKVVQDLETICRDSACAIIAVTHLKDRISEKHDISNLVLAPQSLWAIARNAWLLQQDSNGQIIVRNQKTDSIAPPDIAFRIEKYQNKSSVVVTSDSIPGVDPLQELQHRILYKLYVSGCTNIVTIASSYRQSYKYPIVVKCIQQLIQDKLIEQQRFSCYNLTQDTRDDMDRRCGKNVVQAIPTSSTFTALLP